MTYTLYHPVSGDVLGRGLSAGDAADRVLTHDNHTYLVVPNSDGGYDLYMSRYPDSRDYFKAWAGRRPIHSDADNPATAWVEIAPQVLLAAWPTGPVVLTDEEYDAMTEETEE